jgi:hypothetical protein
VHWRHLLYRGFLHYEGRRVDVIVGRQRVAWGVGRLWNPIDRFNAIPPLALEPDQSAGIDAALLRWSFNGFDFLEAVYAPGTSRDEMRAALRLHGVLWNADLSLMGGIFERAPTAGFDLARNLGDAAIRVEAVYTDPERDVWRIGDPAPTEPSPFWQVVLSLDTNLDLGSGLYVLVEHLYNGNALGFGRGRAGPLLGLFEATATPPAELPPGVAPLLSPPFVTSASTALFGGSRVVSFARHQTGLWLGYDLTPELRLDALAICDWNGPSAVFFPALRYTPTGWIELTLGLQSGVGPRRSEYGQQGEVVYLLGEYFF